MLNSFKRVNTVIQTKRSLSFWATTRHNLPWTCTLSHFERSRPLSYTTIVVSHRCFFTSSPRYTSRRCLLVPNVPRRALVAPVEVEQLWIFNLLLIVAHPDSQKRTCLCLYDSLQLSHFISLCLPAMLPDCFQEYWQLNPSHTRVFFFLKIFHRWDVLLSCHTAIKRFDPRRKANRHGVLRGV